MSFRCSLSDKVDCKKWGTELLNAAQAGEEKKVIEALRCDGADKNYARSSDGVTSLLLAALYGRLQVVKFLLGQYGIDVNKAGGVDYCFHRVGSGPFGRHLCRNPDIGSLNR